MLKLELIDGESVIGGGAAPTAVLPTLPDRAHASRPQRRRTLRPPAAGDPPIIARVEEGRVLLDLRTVFPEQDAIRCRGNFIPVAQWPPSTPSDIQRARLMNSSPRSRRTASRRWSTSAPSRCRADLPHFNRESLESELSKHGIRYVWMKALGGYRKATRQDSPHTGLRNASFRNYADYTLTPEFEQAIGELLQIAGSARTAYMCAERVYFRCHRMIVSDWLVAHGHEVLHIDAEGPVRRTNSWKKRA